MGSYLNIRLYCENFSEFPHRDWYHFCGVDFVFFKPCCITLFVLGIRVFNTSRSLCHTMSFPDKWQVRSQICEIQHFSWNERDVWVVKNALLWLRSWVWFPVSTKGSSHPPVSPAPGDLMPSFDLCIAPPACEYLLPTHIILKKIQPVFFFLKKKKALSTYCGFQISQLGKDGKLGCGHPEQSPYLETLQS